MRLARFAVRRPGWTLALAGLAALAGSLTAATQLTLKTSNLDLVDPALPEVRRFRDFAAEFGTPNSLVVVFEGNESSQLAAVVDRVAPALESISGVRSVMSRSPIDESVAEILGEDVYLKSRDGGLYFIFVQPGDSESRAETIGPLVEEVRRVLADSQLQERGVRAGLTGLPAYAIDDRDGIRKDISRLSLVGLVVVMALFAAAFGSLRRPLFAIVALLSAVGVVLGLVVVYPGHLTLLSAFFASILFGLGIDYGIHIVDRLEELMSQGVDERSAIVEAITDLAPALTTSALTTAFVFFCMQLSGFRGFAELGLIAGAGVLLCLLANVSVLPALLVLFSGRVGNQRPRRRLGAARVLSTLQQPWLATLLLVAAVMSVASGPPDFDSDYLNLQAKDSEAVRLEREMVNRSEYSPQFAAFTVSSPAEVRSLSERLLDEESVGEIHSVADFGMLSPYGDQLHVAESVLELFKSADGRYAVYAYPSGDIWSPRTQEIFVGAMKAIDARVTGMPLLGRFMVERSKRALKIAAVSGGMVLLFWVWLDFRAVRPALAALLPTALTVATLGSAMRLMGIDLNPLSVMALPIVMGIAVDDGVHIVHRYIAESGDLRKTLGGTGRSITLTSLTTIAAFGALTFASHQGLASFAATLVLGVSSALVFSLLVLPTTLKIWMPGAVPVPKLPTLGATDRIP